MTIGGIQDDTRYDLEAADGSLAVFNDPEDDDYVGFARFTGLDDSTVRQVSDDKTEADGSVPGNFWRGPRPIVANVELVPESVIDRNTKYDKIMRALGNSLRSDSTLTWTPDGSAEQFVRVRKQESIRRGEDPGWQTRFQLPMIAHDPFKYSTALHTIDEGDPLTIANAGNGETPILVTVNGPTGTDSITLTNTTTGETITLGTPVAASNAMSVDFAARTMLMNDEVNVYNVESGEWWKLSPGNNTLELTTTSTIDATAGPQSPGTGTNVTGTGTVAWTNPGNILADENVYATAVLTGSGVVSNYLRASNFGFAIPTTGTTTINGIQVEIDRFNQSGTNNRDTIVRLVDDTGTIVGINLAALVTDWPSTEETKTYGDLDYLWDTSWTAAKINDTDFGVVLAAKAEGGAATAAVDHIRISVAYTNVAASPLTDYEIAWRDAWQ